MKYRLKKQGRFFKIFYNQKKIWLPLSFFRNLKKFLAEEIPPEELEEMIFALLKERVLFLFSLRDRTELEIKLYIRKLKQERFEKRIFKFLKKLNLLNDRAFGVKFLSYQKSRSFGPFIIKKDLLRKGLKKNLVEEIIKKEYTLREEEQIAKRLAKKYVNFKPIKKRKDLLRLSSFLKNRGFHLNIIYQIISIYGKDFF